MGGYVSRQNFLGPTVAELLRDPGKTVETAGKVDEVAAILQKRFAKHETAATSSERDERLQQRRPAVPSRESVLPLNTEVIDVHLFASSCPIARESVDALVALGVRTIVSLVLVPLTAERACNPNLSEHKNPEWTDRDPDMLEGLFKQNNCKAIHLPVTDAGTLSSKQCAELISICATAREKDEAVLLHCWLGSRRTWSSARMVKRTLDKIDAKNIYKEVNGKEARSNFYDREFLQSDQFPAAPSTKHERLQLLALAVSVHAVRGGGGVLDTAKKVTEEKKVNEGCQPSPAKKSMNYSTSSAAIFTSKWPSIKRELDQYVEEDRLLEILAQQESALGLKTTAEQSTTFPKRLCSGWKAFADEIVSRACFNNTDLVASVMEEITRRGGEDIRNEYYGPLGVSINKGDSFAVE